MSTQSIAKPHASSKFHAAAAAAYELAADHHRKAGQHRDRGEGHEANNLAASARMHARTGDEQAQAARAHSDD